MREDVGAEGNVRVQGAGGADTQDVQGLVHGLDLAGGEIDVGEGVQLGHHDVDVVGADAMGKEGDALAVPPAGDGDELAGGVPEFDVFQHFGDHVDPAGVAHEDDVVGQFFRLEVDVEHGAVAVDDEFGFRDSHGKSIM